MSRFTSIVMFASSLAIFTGGAPQVFAQNNIAAHAKPMMGKAQASAKNCFTEDMNPGDDSSRIMICPGNGPATPSFAP